MAWASLRTPIVETAVERLSQNVDAFNAASNGGILLSSPNNVGDFVDQIMFGQMEKTERRTRANGEGTEATIEVPQVNATRITVYGRFGPYHWNAQDPAWQGMADSAVVNALSGQVASNIMKDQINTLTSAAIGAITEAADTVSDISASVDAAGAISLPALNNTLALLGDASMGVACICMNGVSWHLLVGDAISNSNSLFDYDGIRVQDFMGKPYVVYDAPAFTVSTTDYHILALNPAGATTENQGSPVIAMTEKTGENITRQFQGDYSYQLGLKGMAYGGTADPSDAELATGSNRTAVYTSAKAGVGALLTANQFAG